VSKLSGRGVPAELKPAIFLTETLSNSKMNQKIARMSKDSPDCAE
jgi:hypothetical protein